MWIENQNTHIKVFMGIVLSFLIYQISISAKFNKNALLQNLLITLIGFSLALFQLIKGNKEKSISNVIAFKNEMSRYDHIHVRLLPNGEWENLNGNYFLQQGYDVKLFGDLVSYLGLFEIANEMIENGTLNIKQFNTFFSYRINNIFSNASAYFPFLYNSSICATIFSFSFVSVVFFKSVIWLSTTD